MSNLLKELRTHVEKRGLLRAGERVGVAVSAGADSVALLRLLLELREKLGIVLSVVHFNHKLRGVASGKDEKFVAALAEKHGLTLHIGRSDVAKKAKNEKANLEDAARRARYDFFRKLTEAGLVDCVATAHTADDQAETVLAHILRGTGLAGLGGIHPTTKDGIVRPLLSARRAELRKYLRAKKQAWREDLTNRDISRQRARMRKKLLPLLEKEFNPKSVEHLGNLAQLAREDEAYLSIAAQLRCDALSQSEETNRRIPARDLASLVSGPLAKRMIRLLVQAVRTGGGEIAASHVEAIRELAEHGENGKLLQLPGGVDVRRDDDHLIFLKRLPRAKKTGRNFLYETGLSEKETRIAVKEIGCVMRIRSIDWPSAGRETITTGVVALDQEKLQGKLILRALQPGDRMRPQGHQKAHKLKRLLNEKRVSRWDRDGWPVLVSGENIVWARGFVAADFAATDETRQAILISEEPA